MKHYILIAFIASFCFMACSDNTTDLRIELARPEPTVVTQLATAVFTWSEVDKAGGYAYVIDDSEDYIFLDKNQLTTTVSGLIKGEHVFKIYAVGEEGVSTDSKTRELEFIIDPSIPAPSFTYREGTNKGDVIITWTEVKEAIGYAYKVGVDGDWIEVPADVLTITLTGVDFKIKTPFTIKSLGNPPLSEDSEEYTDMIDMKTANGVWIIGHNTSSVEMKETGINTNIFNATISSSSFKEFYVNIDNVKHGFMSYSGNGGVGAVRNEYAAAPFYNNGEYYVRESIGLMSNDDSNFNDFYINTYDECMVFVEVDMNFDIPSYYLKIVNSDKSIILAQYFDLMAYGGDWMQSNIGGTSYAEETDTGLSAGKKGGAKSGTTFGSAWLDETFPASFVKNRGMENWNFKNIFEFAGYIRLSNTNKSNPQYGMLMSPKLKDSGNMKVTFDGALFASFKGEGLNAFIEVSVLNGGKISAAKVVKDGNGPAINIEPVSNNKFHIIERYHTNYANSEEKSWSNYSFEIEGATEETQIMWNCGTDTSIASSFYRYCLDNIIVKKE